MPIDRRPLRGALTCSLLGAALASAALAGAAPPVASPATAVASEAGSQAPPEPSFGSALSLDDLVEAVLARNPSLAEMQAAVRAARARAEQSTSLDDPMATAMVAPLSLGGGAPFGYEVRASQRIPYPGKLRLRGEAARQEAEAAVADLEAARLELATEAVERFADYYLNARELEINTEHLELLADFQEVATARYAAGLVPQQAPIQAEVEAARMLHHGVELRAEQRRLVAQLDALLHRSPEDPLPPPPHELPVPPAAAMEHTAALAVAVERPEVRAQRAAIAAREAELALARRARYPDFEAMAGYSSMWDTPEHRFTVGVGVNVPLRRRRIAAEVASAEAEVDKARAGLERLGDQYQAEVVSATAEREEMAHLVELYTDRVIPAARDQVAATRASFESGGESMLGLIEAQRSLRDAQLEYQRALAGYLRAQATLSRSLGELPNLPAMPAADAAPEEQ